MWQGANDLVVIVLDIELNPAERTLMTAGRGEAVRVMGETFEQAIAATFSAIVGASDRPPRARLRELNEPGEPLYAVEVSRLRPESSPRDGD